VPVKKCPPGCECGKHKRHVRLEARGRKLSPEHKEKLRQGSLGRKMPVAQKKKISEGQIRRYRRGEEQMPYKLPEKKRCSQCKKIKVVETSFSVRPRKIKSGDTRYYADPECKKCVAERTKKWRDKKRAEGTLSKIQKGYRQNISDEKKKERREYNREYQAAKRREAGVKSRGALLKYRDKGSGRRVKSKPFTDFVKEIARDRGYDNKELATRTGVDPSQLERILKEYERKRNKKTGRLRKVILDKVTLGLVDQILAGLDRSEMLTILYPE
jgi:hypothetical protein